MNGEKRIQFAEASQAFLCDEYSGTTSRRSFMRTRSLSNWRNAPTWPASPESPDSEKLSVLKLTKESPALKQEIGDGLIERFLAADKENKAQNT